MFAEICACAYSNFFKHVSLRQSFTLFRQAHMDFIAIPSFRSLPSLLLLSLRPLDVLQHLSYCRILLEFLISNLWTVTCPSGESWIGKGRKSAPSCEGSLAVGGRLSRPCAPVDSTAMGRSAAKVGDIEKALEKLSVFEGQIFSVF